jgi:hypothetical protein
MCENTIQRNRRKTQALAASPVGDSDNKNMLTVKLRPRPEDERIQQNERKQRSGDKRVIDSDAVSSKKKAPKKLQSLVTSEHSVSQSSSSKEGKHISCTHVHHERRNHSRSYRCASHNSRIDDGVTFKESIEKARALSRLYSQRNRDKQKNIIDELTQERSRLDAEKSELQGINRQIQEALQTAMAENRLLRQQHLLQSQLSMSLPSAALAFQLGIPPEWHAWFETNVFPHK